MLAVAACGEPPEQAKAPSEPPLTALSIHDMLVNCAGAMAAAGTVDPLVEPSTGTREEDALWTVLALMDKEPGLFGAAGREAAAGSKAIWETKPEAARTARAAECMQRFRRRLVFDQPLRGGGGGPLRPGGGGGGKDRGRA